MNKPGVEFIQLVIQWYYSRLLMSMVVNAPLAESPCPDSSLLRLHYKQQLPFGYSKAPILLKVRFRVTASWL